MSKQHLRSNLYMTLTPLPASSPGLAVLVLSASFLAAGWKATPSPSTCLYSSYPSWPQALPVPHWRPSRSPLGQGQRLRPGLSPLSLWLFRLLKESSSHSQNMGHMPPCCLMSSLLGACCWAKSLTQFLNVNVQKNHTGYGLYIADYQAPFQRFSPNASGVGTVNMLFASTLPDPDAWTYYGKPCFRMYPWPSHFVSISSHTFPPLPTLDHLLTPADVLNYQCLFLWPCLTLTWTILFFYSTHKNHQALTKHFLISQAHFDDFFLGVYLYFCNSTWFHPSFII